MLVPICVFRRSKDPFSQEGNIYNIPPSPSRVPTGLLPHTHAATPIAEFEPLFSYAHKVTQHIVDLELHITA